MGAYLEIPVLFLVLNMISHSFAALNREISYSILVHAAFSSPFCFTRVLWDATKDLLNYAKTNMNCSLQIHPRKNGRCQKQINILGLLSEVVRTNFYFLCD